MALPGFRKPSIVRPVQRRQARVQLIFRKWHLDRVPGYTWYDSLHQQFQRGKAIQQRLSGKVEATAADLLVLPSFKTLNLISGSKELKIHDHQQSKNSDITDF